MASAPTTKKMAQPATFYQPVGLDAERLPTFAKIVNDHASASPDSTLFLVPDTAHKSWLKVTWGQFDSAVKCLTAKYHEQFGQLVKDSYAKNNRAPTFNLMVSPAEDVFLPLLALNAAGISVLPTNPFLPADMVLEIAGKCKSDYIIMGGNYLESLIPEVRAGAEKANIPFHKLEDFELLSNLVNHLSGIDARLKEMHATVGANSYPDDIPIPDPALGLHSTGSTSGPKIIPWRNASILNQIKRNVALDGFLNGAVRKARPDLATTAIHLHKSGAAPAEQRKHDPLEGERVVFISKEPFAIAPLGIVLKILFLGVGWPIAFPRFRSTNFTVLELLEDLLASKCMEYSIYAAELANIANYFQRKLTGEEAEKQARYKEMMQGIGPIPVGGSRVERSVARLCIHHGIKFQVTLGTTEAGFVLASNPSRIRKAWGKPLESIDERDLALSLGMNIFPDTMATFDESKGDAHEAELWVDCNDLGFSDTKLGNEKGEWRSKDLFRSRDLVDDDGNNVRVWEYHCRLDDAIMLGNGENVAPQNLEDVILTKLAEHPELGVNDILIVGTSRPVPAIILEAKRGGKPLDIVKIREVLRPTLADLCKTLPSFFPLREDKILCLQPWDRLPRTVKEIVHRGKAELQYRGEIDRVYQTDKPER